MRPMHPIATRVIAVLVCLSLLVWVAPPGAVAQEPAAQDELQPLERGSVERTPVPVPQEIVDFFGDGLTVEEFVAQTGYVPRALEGLVEEDMLVIIQLEAEPAAMVYARAREAGQLMAQGTLDAYRRQLETAQAAVMAQAQALGAREISRYDTVYNGIQALVPASRLSEIRALPGVKAVKPAPIHVPSLAASVPLIGATDLGTDLGLYGEGLVIGVIDTGIDYTHAALGGSGDPDDYEANDPAVRETGSFPTAKVIGGYDFAGSDYDASGELGSVIPVPDSDPLDEYGHGTHVASIAAGIDGGEVSRGVAPAAGLIAYKVFGRQGSTSLTMDALEMATEDYMSFGFPDVINMSLGSPFGVADPEDPDVAATDAASAAGIMVVTSAGNEGAVDYIAGSPGVASSALSVAATTTGQVTGPAVTVPGSSDPDLADIIYQPPAFEESGQFLSTITAPLGVIAAPGTTQALACNTAPPAPGSLTGQIALIERGTCTYSEKLANAANAGAIAALVYNSNSEDGRNERITMAGTSPIPAGFLARDDGLDLQPFGGQTIQVSAVDAVISVPDPYVPADRLAAFSSAGPRGYDSALKPEIAAPGVGIFAAKMGSGTGGTSMSGTSMAAPHVAGVAALVLQAHPEWTPEMVKAAIMNTGVDLPDGSTLPRAGAGRVDAYTAATTDLIAIADPDLVSLSWGVLYSKAMTETLTSQVTLHNAGDSIITGTTSAALQPGSLTDGVLELEVTPEQFALEPGANTTLQVDLTVSVPDLASGQLPPLEGYFGYVSAGNVRVPFYFTPQPYAALEITGDDTITNPLDEYALMEVSHTGSIASSLWMYPALYASEAPNPGVAENASIRMLGMDYIGRHGTFGDLIGVAINAWGPWHVPQPYFSEFDLYLDPNGDGTWDYVDFNFSYAWLQGGYGNDWIVVRVDLGTGTVTLGSPFYIGTDYNSALMEWYLPAGYMGMAPGDTEFGYELLSWDQYGSTDQTPAGRLDYGKAPFVFGWTALEPGPGEPTAYLGAWVYDLAGYRLANPAGVMVVDYVGNPTPTDGAQAYFWPVDVVFQYQYWFPLIHNGD